MVVPWIILFSNQPLQNPLRMVIPVLFITLRRLIGIGVAHALWIQKQDGDPYQTTHLMALIYSSKLLTFIKVC